MGELETEDERSRAEIAAFLRDLAEQLEDDGPVTMTEGDRRVSLDPIDPVTVKLEGESDWSEGDPQAKESIEVELVWWRDVDSAAEAALDAEPAD